MDIRIRPYDMKYLKDAVMIWNQVVEDGVAFPQTEPLTEESGHAFFEEQSFTGIACEEGMSWGSISYIPIMSDAAVISAMRAMRCARM